MRTSPKIIIFLLSLSIHSIAFEINDFFPDERDALLQLRDTVTSSADLHANWTGPPCSTANQSRWTGVACSDWHITRLVLEGIQLTGSLPPMFLNNLTFLNTLSFTNNSLQGPLPNLTNLLRIEFVLLSRNHFSGSIPSSYINLPNLATLELQENNLSAQIPPFDQQSLTSFNVSSNQLEGPIPGTPVLQGFPESSYGNNPKLCGDIPGLNQPCPISVPPPAPSIAPAPPPRKKGGGALKLWGIALIASAAALVPVSLILICFCCYKRVSRKSKKDQVLPGEADIDLRGKGSHWSESTDDHEKTLELEFLDKPIFDLDDLLRSAAEEIWRGESGSTYKATLECGSVVAVKRLKEMKTLSKKEFVQQMHLLGSLKHENIAEMISFYHSKEKLIINAYVSDKSLFSLLHENRGMGRVPLDWNTRVSIIKEIAKGVEFLHGRLASQRVPHGDLSSSSVVIQRDQNGVRVKLTDYGLLPLVRADKLSVGRTPEFGEGKKLTSKADVYCFGILVLEIVTGRAPTVSSSSSDEKRRRDLSGWVRAAVSNDWSTDILDVEILGEKEGYDEMLKLTEIALECTDEVAERRPDMSHVLSRLDHCNII